MSKDETLSISIREGVQEDDTETWQLQDPPSEDLYSILGQYYLCDDDGVCNVTWDIEYNYYEKYDSYDLWGILYFVDAGEEVPVNLFISKNENDMYSDEPSQKLSEQDEAQVELI